MQTNIYPYTRGNNNLASIVPPWAHEGGTAKMLQRLQDPAQRQRVTESQLTADVVQRVVRVRHDDHRQAEGRHLGERGRARPAHDEVGGGEAPGGEVGERAQLRVRAHGDGPRVGRGRGGDRRAAAHEQRRGDTPGSEQTSDG